MLPWPLPWPLPWALLPGAELAALVTVAVAAVVAAAAIWARLTRAVVCSWPPGQLAAGLLACPVCSGTCLDPRWQRGFSGTRLWVHARATECVFCLGRGQVSAARLRRVQAGGGGTDG